MHQQGYGEDRATPFAFLQLRAGFVQRYREVMKDNTAIPPADILARAVSGNWSNDQFDNEIELKDPKYTGTEAYKSKETEKQNKRDSFAWYWKSVMGNTSPVDASLVERFASGPYTEPRQLFDEIQASPEFAAQYPDWSAFSSGQTAMGQNAAENPLLYKAYQKAFQDALSNEGLQAPGLEHQFFASGIDPVDFANNVAQYGQQQESYQWQTGEEADLATASGVGDKTAGGTLRKRLDEAIKQHQAYAQSKFKDFQTQEVAGNLVQKV